MPTRDELIAVLAKDWRDSGYDLDFQRTADAVLALFAAEPGVAVPEPGEQRCGHCDGTGEWVQPWGAGCVLIKDCEYCKGTGRPAASPVAQEDQEQRGRSDSARWCETCSGYGDHHTDRHEQ